MNIGESKRCTMQELFTGRIQLMPNDSCSPRPEAGRGEQENRAATGEILQ